MKAHMRGHGMLLAIVGGSVLCASAIAGLIVSVRDTGTVAGDRYQTGTIQFASQGSACQRLVIDNTTFAIKPGQQLPCGDVPRDGTKKDTRKQAAPKEAARPTLEPTGRYSSGGRVDAIRDSFNSR